MADNGIISLVRENHLGHPVGFFYLLRGSAGVENAFAAGAELMGLTREHKVIIDIPELTLDGKKYRLWQYPQYSQLAFSTPDVLGRSLI